MKTKIKIFLFFSILSVAFVSCVDDPIPDTVADFTFTPEENIQVGDTVFFTNTSTEALSYVWNFGDDETSIETDPFHIYTEPGTYDVTLVATNGDVTNSATFQVSVGADLCYIINYGSYGQVSSTISAFDKYSDEVINNYYKSVNSVDLISNIQYAYNYGDKIYLMGNASDEVSWVDSKTFKQTENAISADIVKPRYCIGSGDYLYVSCWGGDLYFGDLTLSYIAKINLTSKTVEKKIPLHGGPEGLSIVDNKLYVALNYKDSIAVMDLSSEEITYIETPALTSYFVKDQNNNLYVSLIRAWDDYTTQTGIGYINTSTNELDAFYPIDGVSSSYVNIMEPNADFSKLYVMTSGYDANWNVIGAIASFNVSSKSFDNENLVNGISGINGVEFFENKVFCFVAETVTGNGKVVTYTEDGTKLKEYETGLAPAMMLNVE